MDERENIKKINELMQSGSDGDLRYAGTMIFELYDAKLDEFLESIEMKEFTKKDFHKKRLVLVTNLDLSAKTSETLDDLWNKLRNPLSHNRKHVPKKRTLSNYLLNYEAVCKDIITAIEMKQLKRTLPLEVSRAIHHLSSYLVSDMQTSPELLRKGRFLWTDFEKGFVFIRNGIIESLDSAIIEKKTTVVVGKSGAGKTTLVLSFGYQLLTQNPDRAVYYCDLSQADMISAEQMILWLSTQHYHQKHDTQNPSVIFIDNMHLNFEWARKLHERALDYIQNVRVVFIARSTHETVPLELKHLTQTVFKKSDTIPGANYISLKRNEFKEAVRDISVLFFKQSSISIEEGHEERVTHELVRASEESLTLLTFVLKGLDRLSGSTVSVTDIIRISVTKEIERYYLEDLFSKFREHLKNDREMDNSDILLTIYTEVLLTLAIFNSFEIPVPMKVISDFISSNVSERNAYLSEEMINWLHTQAEIIEILEDGISFYSLTHLTIAEELLKSLSSDTIESIEHTESIYQYQYIKYAQSSISHNIPINRLVERIFPLNRDQRVCRTFAQWLTKQKVIVEENELYKNESYVDFYILWLLIDFKSFKQADLDLVFDYLDSDYLSSRLFDYLRYLRCRVDYDSLENIIDSLALSIEYGSIELHEIHPILSCLKRYPVFLDAMQSREIDYADEITSSITPEKSISICIELGLESDVIGNAIAEVLLRIQNPIVIINELRYSHILSSNAAIKNAILLRTDDLLFSVKAGPKPLVLFRIILPFIQLLETSKFLDFVNEIAPTISNMISKRNLSMNGIELILTIPQMANNKLIIRALIERSDEIIKGILGSELSKITIQTLLGIPDFASCKDFQDAFE